MLEITHEKISYFLTHCACPHSTPDQQTRRFLSQSFYYQAINLLTRLSYSNYLATTSKRSKVRYSGPLAITNLRE